MHNVFFGKGFDFVYNQALGALYLADSQDGRAFIGRGYSGYKTYANNKIWESLKRNGPIPRGMWRMASPIKHETLGPVAIPLAPTGHAAFGRSGFYIHGDNRAGDGSASTGCIILDRPTRDVIVGFYRAGVRTLVVE